MRAILYSNASDKVVVSKSLTQLKEIQIELKDDTSLVNPTFIFSVSSKYPEANYIFVPDLGRYYYINDITFSQNRGYINCHVDVLMSFWNKFKNNTCVISRNEKTWNLYQNDEKMKVYQYTATRTIPFPIKPFSMTNTQFIVGVVGNTSD